MNIEAYGFDKSLLGDYQLPENTLIARITATHRDRYEIICEQGEGFAVLKTSEYYVKIQAFPTTGDFVVIDKYEPISESRIIKTLSRKTFFSRRDPTPGRGEQAVAANFDYVFIMQSLNFDFNIKRVERYLTLAWQSGAMPVVVLTKADLVDGFERQKGEIEGIAPGISVVGISSKDGTNLGELAEYMKPGKTVVFLGSSGVGKSTLLNALAGEELMQVNEIREDDSKGRHTTTYRQLVMLPGGVMIIDTPGMRELGMWDVTEGISKSFTDVDKYIGCCKFSDCTHTNEPGCAIREALESGELSAERWESYKRLKHEAKYSDDKAGALKEKFARNKIISKNLKEIKKHAKRRK